MYKSSLLATMAFLFLGCSTVTEKPIVFDTDSKYSAIVRLYHDSNFACTAFVISDQYAITAAHCVSSGPSFFGIPSPDLKYVLIGNEQDHIVAIARVVGANHRLDYALLESNFSNFRHLTVDYFGFKTFKAQSLISCGYPSNSRSLVCSEFIKVGTYYFYIKAQGGIIFPGHSGGPVFDKETGMVIALNSGAIEDGFIFAPLTTFLSNFGLDKNR